MWSFWVRPPFPRAPSKHPPASLLQTFCCLPSSAPFLLLGSSLCSTHNQFSITPGPFTSDLLQLEFFSLASVVLLKAHALKEFSHYLSHLSDMVLWDLLNCLSSYCTSWHLHHYAHKAPTENLALCKPDFLLQGSVCRLSGIRLRCETGAEEGWRSLAVLGKSARKATSLKVLPFTLPLTRRLQHCTDSRMTH